LVEPGKSCEKSGKALKNTLGSVFSGSFPRKAGFAACFAQGFSFSPGGFIAFGFVPLCIFG